MTVHELKGILEDLPDEMPVDVIFNGQIDERPTCNVADDDHLYIEGAAP